MKQFELVYTIEKSGSWRSEKGLDIKSNLSDDELVDCRIASSLVKDMKEGAVLLEPDKLLLGFAEAQKRGIQDNLAALNEFELTAKNNADSVHQKLLTLENESETKYNELLEKFSAITNSFDEKINKVSEKLIKQLDVIKAFDEKFKTINAWSFDTVSESISKVLTLIEKDPELVKIVFKNKFGEEK
jgi:hypothetical protein